MDDSTKDVFAKSDHSKQVYSRFVYNIGQEESVKNSGLSSLESKCCSQVINLGA
jgi:hypothetical protein